MSGEKNLNIRSFFEHKGKKKFFTAYILVIFCFFAFTLAAFAITMRTLNSVFDANNRLIVNTVSVSLNEAFKKVDNVYKALENAVGDEDIFGFADTEAYVSEENGELTAEINQAIQIYDFVEETVLLSKEKEYLVTSKGSYEKTEFFNNVYNNEKYGSTFFENLITDYMNVKVIPATAYKNLLKFPAEDPQKLFVFVKTNSEKNMNILLFVPESKFIKLANLDAVENRINLKVYDYNNSVVYSNNDRNYYISTKNISKDFEEVVEDRNFKKYYIIKSGYNYFYYVAEIDNYILISGILSLFLILIGLFVALFILMKRTNKITEDLEPVYKELGLISADNDIYNITEEIKNYKNEISVSRSKVDTMSDEIKNSTFLKLINSSSFYTRNRKTVDFVFEKISGYNRFFILSVEAIKENNRFPKFEIEAFASFFSKLQIEYVHIEEKTRKNLFVCAVPDDMTVNEIMSQTDVVLEDIRRNGIEVLVCHSKEFKEISNIYDSFREIKICRDYRGINDKTSVLSTETIRYESHLYLPINLKEELTGRLMAQEEENAKQYVKEIFEENINNNIPLSKFEFMLRQMLSILTESLTLSKKSAEDLYELEQVFLLGIENLKDNFDVGGIINSFVNLLHLTVSLYDSKKNTLNRTAVIKYINNSYADDLYLEKIATEFGTTPKYFSNYFKKEFGVGFNEYLTQIRISHAKQLLTETELSLSETSMKVGYSNQATFAVAFKKTVGVPPGKYREMNSRTN